MATKKDNKRMIVFLAIVAIIIVVTVVIIITNGNSDNKVDVNQEQTQEGKLEAKVNPNATPESNPSIAGIENVEEENGLKVNTSNKIKEEKTFGIYKLNGITMVKGSTGTTITGTLTANVTEKTPGKDAIIKFYDKDGKLLSQMGTYIPQVKPNEGVIFNTETTADVANAYDFSIEF